MATPVVTVASGGLPVVDVTASTPKLGLPVTEALAGRGMAVTKVAARGTPVTYSTVADYPPSQGSYSPEVTAWLARATSLTDPTTIAADAAFIDGLIADNVWGKFDVIGILATQNSPAALLSMKSAAFFSTAVNAPTFTVNRGFTGAATGVKHLMTNFNPVTAGGQYAQNSAHLSLWNLTAAGQGPPAIGCNVGTTNQANMYVPNYSGDNQMYVRINSDNVGGGMGPSNPNTVGYYLGNRTASNSVNCYRNGSASGYNPSATTSVAMPSLPMAVLGINVSGTVSPVDMQAAAFTIGSALNATEALAVYNRLRTRLTAVGVP